jgi:hypothetical protein
MEPMRRALLLFLGVVVAACSGTGEPASLDTSTLTIHGQAGPVSLTVEVADSDDERATGLMHRGALEPYDGMAFLWPEPVTSTFTMRNTLIPLSIAFWDERGRIVAILDMEPCEAEPCPSYEVRRTYVGAVEVERGAFDELGIAVGDRVELVEAGT